MSKVSKTSAVDTLVSEGFEGHYQDLDGYTVGFETYTAHADMAPLFAGLPDDRCQCSPTAELAKTVEVVTANMNKANAERGSKGTS